MLRQYTKGDTIIEVLLAITVFSAVAVGALAVMNRTVAVAQQSLELTQVRQQIDAQAELLRYLHSARTSSSATTAPWNDLRARAVSNQDATITPGALDADNRCRPIGSLPNSFVIHPTNISIVSLDQSTYVPYAPTYAKVEPNGTSALASGLWVQAKYVRESAASNPEQRGGYIDFYVQACWDVVGASLPKTISTTVRLYDPDTPITAGTGGTP